MRSRGSPERGDRRTSSGPLVGVRGTMRIGIDTPSLKGSIALKGARLDDLVLTEFKVSVKPAAQRLVAPPVVRRIERPIILPRLIPCACFNRTRL